MSDEELPAPSDGWKTARGSSSRRGMRRLHSLGATCGALALACFDTTTPPNPAASAGADVPPPSAAPVNAPAHAASANASPEAPPLDPSVCREVVETLAQQLRAEYVFADKGDEMARALGGWLDSGSCSAALSGGELARSLTTELQARCHDKHLRIFHGPRSAEGRRGPPGMGDRGVGGIRKREILDGNVGYLETTSVPPLAESEGAIAEAFAYLSDTAALILDVRANGGGDPNTVARYVSYLSEGPPFVVNTFHWRGREHEEFLTTDLGARSYGSKKPVYVLTSRQTFSGGEELAYDLQALKRAVLVGETTGGGANPGGMQPLGHGFDVGMPKGRAVNPITGTNWEGTGVKPDVEVSADEALTKAHQAALARLQAPGGGATSSASTDRAGRLK